MWQDVKMLNAASSALLALVALALVGSGLWWVAQRPMFTLHTIRIESATELPLEKINALTVRSAAVPRIRGNFFTTDLTAVRGAFEAVPWVRRALVRREWPDRLVVKIEEHRALGTWGEDGKLLSQKGDVFTANLAEAEDDGELLEFEGPEGSEAQVVARLAQFRQWFAPLKLEPESLQLSNRYAWTLRMDNGMTVELGRDQGDAVLKERVDRLVAVYPQLMQRLQGKIENVDLRYPNGLALKADGMVLAGLNGKKK
ncbi:cell division protein FtsQ/DivIB [Herbaspirillum sp. alder98]|uniref:cell division protein FtsQ/DivIB n=1 Tax=Herbaspirillum sp. alder98 TaxID=2913096 RepID=UPI001CD85F56|nr:cell division protein FtsQ/DivIB [Herbaspirillum sp. alder98]MCA1324477.1 cell division protein FtsQ/DivIB [Herbaspirillum sp. alder98]